MTMTLDTLKAMINKANNEGMNLHTIADLYDDLCSMTHTFDAMMKDEDDAIANLERAKKALEYVPTFSTTSAVVKETIKELDKQIEASGKEFDRLEQAWTNACEAINYIEELEQWDLVLA